MNGDIKFDGGWIVVEGNWTRVRTLDLMLDAPSRRKNNRGHRRALVHDSGDSLTINYARDYPGGVRILGKLVIGDDRETNAIEVKGRGLQAKNLNILKEAIFNGPIKTQDVLITSPPTTSRTRLGTRKLARAPFSLLKKIEAMEAEIQSLKQKVALLEGRG